MQVKAETRANVVLTHTQIMDAYLRGLAAHKGGKLATLDRRLPINAVRGDAAALELVSGVRP